MNRANPYPAMAAPLPLKARQALAVQATLRTVRRQAGARRMDSAAFSLAMKRGQRVDPYNTADQL